MEALNLEVIIGDKKFEVCRDIKGDKELYSVFEVHHEGKHYEYIYRDNASGEYTTPPKSKITPHEIIEIGSKLESVIKR